MIYRDGVYRPTLKTAFLTVWRMLPPLSLVHGSRHARLAWSLRSEVLAGFRRG